MNFNAIIEKYITRSCARLSFSILLQDQNVDEYQVIGLGAKEKVNK